MTITERKSRERVVSRKALQIKTDTEKKIRNGSLELQLWAGKESGALEFWLSPQSPRTTAFLLAKLREELQNANLGLKISVIACESTARRGSLQFSFQPVNHHDQ